MPAKIEINCSGIKQKDTVQDHFFYVWNEVNEESGRDSRCHGSGQEERCICLLQKEKQKCCRKEWEKRCRFPVRDQRKRVLKETVEYKDQNSSQRKGAARDSTAPCGLIRLYADHDQRKHKKKGAKLKR